MTFERAQVVEAIRTFVRRLRAVATDYPNRFRWNVFGLEINDILQLDPREPKGIWASKGWIPVGS